MKKGIDYTSIAVSFYCHDGRGNYVFHKRNENCRDEHGRWDTGGGGLEFDESLEDAVKREIEEEYGVRPLEVEFLGFDEVFRQHESQPTHWISFRYRALVDREKVVNNEPHKHSKIMWTTIDTMPSPMHSQVLAVMDKYKKFLK